MSRLLPVRWVLAAGLCAAASCGSPSAPCDPRGSNEGDAMYITCSPTGSDLRCVSHFTNKYDLYVCTAVDYPVTGATVWMSSDPSAGAFDPADSGLLHAVSAGRVEV